MYPRDGRILWRQDLGAAPLGAAVKGPRGEAVIGTATGRVLAIDPISGALAWDVQLLEGRGAYVAQGEGGFFVRGGYDYLYALAVGSAMRKVTDRFAVSREKLAYVVDSTAAPICVLIPVSTWAVFFCWSPRDVSSGGAWCGYDPLCQSHTLHVVPMGCRITGPIGCDRAHTCPRVNENR